jgi:hypothetical protein
MVKTLYDNARQYIEKKNMHLKLVEVINIWSLNQMIRLGVYEKGKISNLERSKLYFRRDSSIQVLEQNQ